MTKRTIRVTVNGRAVSGEAEPRRSLADFLREDLDLTGTHVGCEHGVCGACTVLLGGEPVRSCLLFAVQLDGAEITTVEGLAPAAGGLHPVQEAFWDRHALQCGFCTPGMLLTAVALLRRNPRPTEGEIRLELSGNLCMCTGYLNIIRAVLRAAEILRGTGPGSLVPSPESVTGQEASS